MMSMSDTTAKPEQTAYERWEMSAFSEDEASNHFSPKKTRKTAATAATSLSGALEGVRKEAYTKGMQEGFAVGMSKAKEYIEQEREKIIAMTSAFEQALEEADKHIEEDVLALALDMAKLMLKTKLNVDPAVVLPVVRDAIHYLPNVKQPARIIVHHEDARILREMLGEELAEHAWQIQEDPNIERGGCLVETGENQIDASNETRWKRISDALSQNNDWLLP